MSTDVPSISFIVPTHLPDRPLKRCLDSLDPQLGEHDSVVVVGDTCDGELPTVAQLVQSYGPRYTYLDHNTGRHTYGHDQLNFGIALAQGDWLHCNDDDDIWTPGAVEVMRAATREAIDRPVLFRFLSYHGHLYWSQRGLFQYEQVGGHCLLAPNIEGKIGQWGTHYQGDWSYLESTITLHGGPEAILWRDEVIVVARP